MIVFSVLFLVCPYLLIISIWRGDIRYGLIASVLFFFGMLYILVSGPNNDDTDEP